MNIIEEIMILRYFYLERAKSRSMAYPPESLRRSYRIIYDKKILKNWKPMTFHLKGRDFTDFQRNKDIWNICSEKLKSVIDHICKDQIGDYRWFPVNIVSEKGEIRNYYILIVKPMPSVMNKRRSLVTKGGSILKAILDKNKIEGLNITILSKFEPRVIVSDKLKREIESHKCTGVEFNHIPVI